MSTWRKCKTGGQCYDCCESYVALVLCSSKTLSLSLSFSLSLSLSLFLSLSLLPVPSHKHTPPGPPINVAVTHDRSPELGSMYVLICDLSGIKQLSATVTYQWTRDDGTT